MEDVVKNKFRGKTLRMKKYKIIDFAEHYFNTMRTGSFKLFKHPFPGFLTILTL